jgi:hypothetical protein
MQSHVRTIYEDRYCVRNNVGQLYTVGSVRRWYQYQTLRSYRAAKAILDLRRLILNPLTNAECRTSTFLVRLGVSAILLHMKIVLRLVRLICVCRNFHRDPRLILCHYDR